MSITVKAAHHCLTLMVATFGLVGFLSHSADAQYVFFDRFDSETVGTFPSTWTSVISPTYGQMIVTNNLNAPSTPNAFQVNNVSNEAFRADRSFSTVSLNTSSQVVVGFSIRVDFLTNFNSAGAYIHLCNTSGSDEPFAFTRILGGGPGVWSLYNDYYTVTGGLAYPAQGMSTGVWYNFRWEIDPSPTNAQTGQVRWYLNNSLVNTANIFITGASDTNFNRLRIRDAGSPVMNFSIDNVYMFTEVPEPSSLGLVVLAALSLCGWSNLRRRS